MEYLSSFGCECGKDPNNKDQNAYKVAERKKKKQKKENSRIVGKVFYETGRLLTPSISSIAHINLKSKSLLSQARFNKSCLIKASFIYMYIMYMA